MLSLSTNFWPNFDRRSYLYEDLDDVWSLCLKRRIMVNLKTRSPWPIVDYRQKILTSDKSVDSLSFCFIIKLLHVFHHRFFFWSHFPSSDFCLNARKISFFFCNGRSWMVANFCFVAKKWSRNPRFHIFGRKKCKIKRSYHLKKEHPVSEKMKFWTKKEKSSYLWWIWNKCTPTCNNTKF